MFNTIPNYSNSSFQTNKIKIAIFIPGKNNKYPPSAIIRIISPLNELSNEFSILIIDDISRNQFLNDLQENKVNLDIFICSRDIDIIKINYKYVENLFMNLKKNNIKIIFDLDDDLLNIDENHIVYKKFKRLNNLYKFIISNSDIITVSTHHLKKQIQSYCQNIHIVPNTLIKSWNFSSKKPIKKLSSKKTIKIGYFGTPTHEYDLQIIKKPLLNVKNYFLDKNIELELIGVTWNRTNWATKISLPHSYKKKSTPTDTLLNFSIKLINKTNLMNQQLPYWDFISWVKNEIDWDIGIAPLQDSNINRSKSNLKYLEYVALNIPGIYSNIGPYKEIHEKHSGLVVNNYSKNWEKAIVELIENSDLYENLLVNAQKDVANNYLIENAVKIWYEILKKN